MVPFLGAFPLAAVLLCVSYAVVVATASALSFAVSGAFGGGPLVGGIGSALLSAAGVAVVEGVLRARAARHDPRWAADIRALAASRRVALDRIGGEAQTLARAVALGLPVPDTLVLTGELTEIWLREMRGARRGADPMDFLPKGALGPLQAFLHRSEGGKVLVRPSFRGPDPAATYPGVFSSVGDLEPSNPHGLAAAVGRVVESGDSPAALDYRRRMRQVATLHRSVVLQRQIDGDLSGVAQSRGLDGRADSILIDFAKRRAPTMTVSYDLVDGTVLAVAPDVPLDATPSWMNRLAALVVALDHELGGTVLVQFAVEAGQLWVQSVRRVKTEERTTWVSSGGPLDALFTRQPRFVCETFGDASALVDGANDALKGLAVVSPGDVRFEEGVRYLNVEVLRRALGRLAVEVLLSEPIWRLFALSRPVPRRPFAKPPELEQDVPMSFKKLKAWQARVLLPLTREHVALGLWRWLIEAVIGMLSDGATGEPVPRVHQRLKPVLARGATRCSEESERAKRHLEESEKAVRDFAAQVVARGATDWSGVFVGERHLYAGLEEMERWVTSPGERETLGAAWDEERLGFEARHLMETPERLVEPPPPDTLLSLADSARAVVGLVSGSAEGPAVAPTESRNVLPGGAVIALPDGRPDHAWFVLNAAPGQSLPLGHTLRVDGASGALEVRS